MRDIYKNTFQDWIHFNDEDGTIVILKTIETALPGDVSWVYPVIKLEGHPYETE